MPPDMEALSVFPAKHELFECIHHFIEGKGRIEESSNASFDEKNFFKVGCLWLTKDGFDTVYSPACDYTVMPPASYNAPRTEATAAAHFIKQLLGEKQMDKV